ncbi:AMP-dependent synthetase/ligase [Rubripirellula tenax]|uniref:AMP-dependent synthetase/ligase n=1 Tax=Rubripirellula tenax TaxID=2528015 RepID=UPI001C93AEF9|nr:long-chain fatty acid--CoA ligase [Rubripirellula tenax]
MLEATERFAELPALQWKEAGEWQCITFAELERRVIACGLALSNRGITKGDRVAIWLDNGWSWIVCDLAAQLIGAVTTTIYHTLIPSQAASLLRDSEAKAVLSNQQRLAGLITDYDLAIAVFSEDEGKIGECFATVIEESKRALEAQPDIAQHLRMPPVGPDDLSALFYTSGTTGDPKGVMLTHANLLANTDNTISQLLTEREKTILLHLPLAHVMARNTTVSGTLLSGGRLVIAEPAREKLIANLADVSPHGFPTVPLLLDKFTELSMAAIRSKGFVMRSLALLALKRCRQPRLAAIRDGGPVGEVRLGSINRLLDRIVLQKIREKMGRNLVLVVTGGANSNRTSIEFFWGIGIPVYEGYGATELTCTAALTFPKAMKPGTVGQSVPGVEIKLASDGEVLVRGPIVMKGYWQRPEETAQVLDADGWYHTGDIGTLDEDGYLTIVDRKREILVLSTGKNVAPQAVENALKSTPFVISACAIGDRRRFTAALVVPDLGAIGRSLDLAETPSVDDLCVTEVMRKALATGMSGLSNFERIKRFTLVADPFSQDNGLLTPTLKLQRRKIAEKFVPEIEDLYAESPKRAINVQYD